MFGITDLHKNHLLSTIFKHLFIDYFYVNVLIFSAWSFNIQLFVHCKFCQLIMKIGFRVTGYPITMYIYKVSNLIIIQHLNCHCEILSILEFTFLLAYKSKTFHVR